jgi:hypothetical protein
MFVLGSKTEVELADSNFRFTPQSRYRVAGLACPKSAMRRHAVIAFRASARIPDRPNHW